MRVAWGCSEVSAAIRQSPPSDRFAATSPALRGEDKAVRSATTGLFAGLAAEIAGVIGEASTAKLLGARGGTEMVIPTKATGSLLAELIGELDASRMIAAFGAGKMMLPQGMARGAGAKRRRAQKMLADGASLQSVALACDVHLRTVSNYKAALNDAPSRQFELPFGD